MSRKVVTLFSPRWAGGSLGATVALVTSLAWSQVLPPVPVPATPPVPAVPAVPATPAVPEAVQDATNAAQNTVKDATNTAQEAAKDAANAAQDATKDATKTAKDAAKDASNAAQDAARDAQDATRDATRGARETAKDAARDVRNTTREATDDVRDTARDATRNAREATRDAAQGAREAGREAARDVRGAARNWSDVRGADLGLWFDRSARDSLIISDVAANAALGRFGFVEGDRIVSLAGQPVTTEADFVRLLLNGNVRGPMNVVVLRNGQQQILNVDPIVIRQQMTTTVNVDPLENFGIILDDRYNDRLVVWRVIPRSPAFYAGIRTGDVITTFGGQRIANPNALVQIVQRTQPGMIPIQITRNGRIRTIEADLQASQRYTSGRQNLDADANIRTDETYIRSNVDAGVRAPATAPLPADNAPVLAPTDRPMVTPSYNNNYAPRRGVFRRR